MKALVALLLGITLVILTSSASPAAVGTCPGCTAGMVSHSSNGSGGNCALDLRWAVTTSDGSCDDSGGPCIENTKCSVDATLDYKSCCSGNVIKYACGTGPIITLGTFGASCANWTNVLTITDREQDCGQLGGDGCTGLITRNFLQFARSWGYQCDDCG